VSFLITQTRNWSFYWFAYTRSQWNGHNALPSHRSQVARPRSLTRASTSADTLEYVAQTLNSYGSAFTTSYKTLVFKLRTILLSQPLVLLHQSTNRASALTSSIALARPRELLGRPTSTPTSNNPKFDMDTLYTMCRVSIRDTYKISRFRQGVGRSESIREGCSCAFLSLHPEIKLQKLLRRSISPIVRNERREKSLITEIAISIFVTGLAGREPRCTWSVYSLRIADSTGSG
jgi:hypothetical protein